MVNLDLAKRYLQENGCTCVAFDGKTYLSSTRRGVAPLLSWLEEGVLLDDFAVADKVIGKGAAFLYEKLGAKLIYARVISSPALELLQEKGCCVIYDKLVEGIQNREQTGPCPIESAVLSAVSADEALHRIRAKLQELQNRTR